MIRALTITLIVQTEQNKKTNQRNGKTATKKNLNNKKKIKYLT